VIEEEKENEKDSQFFWWPTDAKGLTFNRTRRRSRRRRAGNGALNALNYKLNAASAAPGHGLDFTNERLFVGQANSSVATLAIK